MKLTDSDVKHAHSLAEERNKQLESLNKQLKLDNKQLAYELDKCQKTCVYWYQEAQRLQNSLNAMPKFQTVAMPIPQPVPVQQLPMQGAIPLFPVYALQQSNYFIQQ